MSESVEFDINFVVYYNTYYIKMAKSFVKKRTVSFAKHITTQTDETDHLQASANRKITIKDYFHKQTPNNCNKKAKATKRLMKCLIKPRNESTPLRFRGSQIQKDSESYDSECEMLIGGVTPIRGRCKSFRSLIEGSNSSRELPNRLSKSDSNVSFALCSSPSTRQMLSLNETCLKSLDLESIVENFTDMGEEPTTRNPDGIDNQTRNINVLNKSCEESVDGEQALMKSTKASKSRFRSSQMPPPLTVIKRIIKAPSKLSQGHPNSITVAADVHWDELKGIDINNWNDDSFMDRALNAGKCSGSINTPRNECKSSMVTKRPALSSDENPILNKKQRKSNTTCEKIGNDWNKNENVKEQSIIATPNFSDCKSSSESCTILEIVPIHKENSLQKDVNEAQSECERINNQEIIVQDDAVGQNKADVENSVNDSNSLRLSVGEKVRRRLVTNARKPVTRRRRFSDAMPSAVELKESKADINLGPFFGLPIEVKSLFGKYKGIKKLYDWQEECLNLKAIHEKTNLVFALPTSGGKTLVAEILLLRELLCYKKNALFVLPYVAIVQEKVHSLSPFAIDLGFLVEEYAAGKGQCPPKKRRQKSSVYVATIEKAHSLINSMIEAKRLSEIGLVIVDELHLLGEGDRGATLECLLTKLRFSSEKIHLVGMSATIGNLEEVAKFLHAEIYINNFRPVELKEYIKCEDTLLVVNYNEEEVLTKVRDIKPPYNDFMARNDPDKVCSLVLEVIPEHSCLVFCASKGNCVNVVKLFVRIMPKELLEVKREERKALIKALSDEGRGSVCPVLQNSIPFGVAYHHSGLTGDERRLLEEAYRVGTLNCICCTSTLAAGVNLPAKRVILRAPMVGCNFISLSQYKQMVGRAGRAGFDVTGESIVMCKKNEMLKINALLRSPMDEAESQIHVSESRGLQSLVLSSIGLGLANRRKDLHKMIASSLLHVQREKFQVKTSQLVDKTVASLFKLGALKVDSPTSSSEVINIANASCVTEQANYSLNITRPEGQNSNVPGSGSKTKKKHLNIARDTCLKISRLGKAAMKGPIDLCRAAELYNDLMQAQTSLVLLSRLHLLYIVTPYDMMDQIKPDPEIYFDVYNSLNKQDMQTARILGINDACMSQIVKGLKSHCVSERVVHRFYVTLILNDLWNQNDVWAVANKYKILRGTLQTLMTSAASFASCVLHFSEELSEFWAFKLLLGDFAQRLSHCSSADLLELMELPAVKTGRARQLYNAGYKTLVDIANAEVSRLVEAITHLPRKTANQIIAAAKLLVISKVENLREEADDLLGAMKNISGVQK